MRRHGWVLIAAAAWTAFVWVTRIGILVGPASGSFKLVHGVLIVVSLAFAAAVARIGVKLLRSR